VYIPYLNRFLLLLHRGRLRTNLVKDSTGVRIRLFRETLSSAMRVEERRVRPETVPQLC
jgi:hypothetical protein